MDYRCSGLATGMHEIAHALGMRHEQQRRDRDNSVSILFGNVRGDKRVNFTTKDNANMDFPYDYYSIMQYSNASFSKNGNKTIVPKNCEPNCPEKLGNFDGFTIMDQTQLATMYHCKKEDVKHWTEKIECNDWKEIGGKAVNCKKYVDDGKCSNDVRPCCACGKWDSGFPSRVYTVNNKKDEDCKDAREDAVCKKAVEKGLCWSGFVRGICERSCEVCTGKRLESYDDDKSVMHDDVGDLVWHGGKYFWGERKNGQPHGKGVYSWGNGAKYVGKFNNGKVVDAMRFHGKDTYVGSYEGWMLSLGKQYQENG